jgi:hypothetical protein
MVYFGIKNIENCFHLRILLNITKNNQLMETLTFVIGGVPMPCQDADGLISGHIPQTATGWRHWAPRPVHKRGNADDEDDEGFPVPKKGKKGYPRGAFPLNVLPRKQLAGFLSTHSTKRVTFVGVPDEDDEDDEEDEDEEVEVKVTVKVEENGRYDIFPELTKACPIKTELAALLVYLNDDVERETVVIGDVDDEFGSE